MNILIKVDENAYKAYKRGIYTIHDRNEVFSALKYGKVLSDKIIKQTHGIEEAIMEIQAEIDNTQEPVFCGACRFCLDIIRKHIGE